MSPRKGSGPSMLLVVAAGKWRRLHAKERMVAADMWAAHLEIQAWRAACRSIPCCIPRSSITVNSPRGSFSSSFALIPKSLHFSSSILLITVSSFCFNEATFFCLLLVLLFHRLSMLLAGGDELFNCVRNLLLRPFLVVGHVWERFPTECGHCL